MAESKPRRNQKYDEMEEDIMERARQTGRRRPVYLEYDAAGRWKMEKGEKHPGTGITFP